MSWRVAMLSAGLGLSCAAATLTAADPSAPGDDAPVVAATVNGTPILAGDVRDAMAPALVGKNLPPQALTQLQAAALAQMIDRRLVEQAISADGKAITAEEIDAAQARLKTQAEAQKLTLERILADQHLTLDALRKQLAWQLLWERAMQNLLTDEVLQAYFDANKKEFDGSEVRASHVLLRPARSGDPGAMAALMKDAATLRERIEAGKISFADAVATFSAGPSREKEGDVGFLPRHGLMVEEFSRAAFALPIGQISQPVVTPFGVHLIKVTEIKQGNKGWTAVKEELKPLAAQALFEKLAKNEREKAKIEFTDAWPHFKPGTHELATPEPPSK